MIEHSPEPIPRLDDVNVGQLPELTYAEAVRMRPGMYIGDTGVSGLHHLFKEIIDNSVDEVLAGYCNQISVTLGKDYSLTVADNGRGLPLDIDAQIGKSIAEAFMTEMSGHFHYYLHKQFVRGGYKTSGGLHGVGAACVNFLSEWMETTVRRDGKIHRMRFSRGVPVSPLEVVGDCGPEEQGTTQRWLADRDIFKTALTDAGELAYQPERLSGVMRELAFLNREVTITFIDALHDAAPVVFHYPEGVAAYVAALNEGKDVLYAPIYLETSHGETQIMVALQHNRSSDGGSIFAFANNISLEEGGVHVTGFKTALTRAINRYARQHNLSAGIRNFAGDAVRAGLTAVVSLRLTNPMFNSASKNRLMNPELEGIVNTAVGRGLAVYFDANPEVARAIIGRMGK